MSSLDVSVIIVSYRSRDLLQMCLQSISEAKLALSHEIIVIDNASRDGTPEMLRNMFADVQFYENRENVGFARGVNIGFAKSLGRYLLLLNPDITVLPSSVESLYRYMEMHADVALSAPKLLNSDHTLQYSCRAFYTFGTFLFRRSPLGRLFPNHSIIRHHLMMDWDHCSARDVDWVLGAALMLRRTAMKVNQIMDERFFLYFEDVDLCLRLHRAGWKVVYNPASVMIHRHQRESAHGILSRAKVEHFRSWLKFEWKHRNGTFLEPAISTPPCLAQ